MLLGNLNPEHQNGMILALEDRARKGSETALACLSAVKMNSEHLPKLLSKLGSQDSKFANLKSVQAYFELCQNENVISEGETTMSENIQESKVVKAMLNMAEKIEQVTTDEEMGNDNGQSPILKTRLYQMASSIWVSQQDEYTKKVAAELIKLIRSCLTTTQYAQVTGQLKTVQELELEYGISIKLPSYRCQVPGCQEIIPGNHFVCHEHFMVIASPKYSLAEDLKARIDAFFGIDAKPYDPKAPHCQAPVLNQEGEPSVCPGQVNKGQVVCKNHWIAMVQAEGKAKAKAQAKSDTDSNGWLEWAESVLS